MRKCAGIAALCGTMAARVAMGSVCDLVGPRLGMSIVLLLTSPFVFGMALASGAAQFTLLRFGIGFGISCFVACQFWSSQMFSVKIVGVPINLFISRCVCVPHCTWRARARRSATFTHFSAMARAHADSPRFESQQRSNFSARAVHSCADEAVGAQR